MRLYDSDGFIVIEQGTDKRMWLKEFVRYFYTSTQLIVFNKAINKTVIDLFADVDDETGTPIGTKAQIEAYIKLMHPEVSGGGGSGISDAPSDGTPYSRQDAGWVSSPSGSSTVPMVILTKAVAANQNVGGANGTETNWSWDGQTIIDSDFTHSTTVNNGRITVVADGWYEITFMGSAQQTGGARTTLQGYHRIDGGAAQFHGTRRNYSRGSGYGNLSMGVICTVFISAGSYIQVGTRVEDTDGVYTINTNDTEVPDNSHQLVIKKIR